MPIVPINTITGPSGARLPNVTMAEPRMADAMGSVAGAMSRQASQAGGFAQNAGRAIGIMGQGIDAERDRLRSQQEIIGAKADSRNAMWNGITDLAGKGIDAAFKLERIYEIRDSREADDAVAEYSNAMNSGLYGSVTPDGQRTPGTLDAPYQPSGNDREPSGAVVATSKMEKDFLEKNEKVKRLSPRAKALFDKRVMEIRDTYLRAAWMQDQKNHAAYKEMQDVAFESANLKEAATVPDADFPAWLASRSTELAMRGTENLQTDPANRDPDKANWRIAGAEGVMRGLRQDFAAKAITLRVGTYQARAVNAATPEEARALLDQAETVAAYALPGSGGPVLAETVREQAKTKNTEIVHGVAQRNAQTLKANIETAKTLKAHQIAGRKVDPKQVDQAMSLVPEDERATIEAVATHAVAVDEMAAWDRWRESLTIDAAFQNGGAGGDLHKQANALIDAFRTDEAKQYAKNTMYSKPIPAHTEAFKAVLASRQMMVMTDQGPKFFPMSDWQLSQLLLNGAGVMYTPGDVESMRKLIAEDRLDEVLEQRIASKIGQMIGNDRLAETFDVVNGQVVYQKQTRDNTGIPMPQQIADDTKLGTLALTGYDRTGRRLFAPTQRRMEVQAKLIKDAFQAAYDYERAPKVMSKSGTPPETLDQFIERLLSPANNLDVREWNNLMAAEEIQRKATITTDMTRRFYEELQAPFYEK